MDEAVATGVELLAKLEREVTVAEAMDRIELVSTNPSTQRAILDAAVERGAIERDGGTVRSTTADYVRFESEVVVREGEFTCERCGADIGEGHFVKLEAAELGPFGSSCVRMLTGRD